MSTGMHVYEAIAAVTEELSKEGISKSRKNQQQGYSFRGIDDVYKALAPALARNKLCVLPRVLERTCEERQNKSGGALFYVNVRVAFDFVSAIDGSKHEILTLGEAMDSGDKATNKAMSAAYKYAALMAFCIPTEGDNDTENSTHELEARKIAALKAGKPRAEVEHIMDAETEPLHVTQADVVPSLEQQLKASVDMNAKGGISFKDLGYFKELKKKIVDETGSEDLYRMALTAAGYKLRGAPFPKSNTIPQANCKEVYGIVSKALIDWRRDKAGTDAAIYGPQEVK